MHSLINIIIALIAHIQLMRWKAAFYDRGRHRDYDNWETDLPDDVIIERINENQLPLFN